MWSQRALPLPVPLLLPRMALPALQDFLEQALVLLLLLAWPGPQERTQEFAVPAVAQSSAVPVPAWATAA